MSGIMRNYIHIQLCVTQGIAQIVFVAGVEPRLGEGGGVPMHRLSLSCCSSPLLVPGLLHVDADGGHIFYIYRAKKGNPPSFIAIIPPP